MSWVLVQRNSRGNRIVAPAPFQGLADLFPGPTVLLSLTQENSAYAGPCVSISRSGGTSPTTIGFSGGLLDMTALNAYLAGGTAFCDTWYDQSGNVNNATQATLSKRFQIIVDTDGKPSLISNYVLSSQTPATTGMTIADAASHKTTVIDLFSVGKIGNTNNDGTNYNQVVAGWMPTGNAESVARWGFVLSEGGFGDGLELVRNGTAGQRTGATIPSTIPIGNGYRSTHHVWHYNSNRLAIRRNDVLLWDDVTQGRTSAANVTYTGTGALFIGQNFGGTENANGTFRTMAIYGTTQSNHSGIESYLQSRWSLSGEFPTSYDSGDGWLWTPQYNSNFNYDSSNDVNGMRWWYEGGSYADDGVRGPGTAIASNVNNGVSLVRFAVNRYDNDTIVTGAERCERGGGLGSGHTEIARGDTFERFTQFWIEPGAKQVGSWALFIQTHYGDGSQPDLTLLNLLNDILVWSTNSNVSGKGGNIGSSTPIQRGVWWAARQLVTWSASGTADSCQIWMGLNGTTLTQVVNTTTGTLFSTDSTTAYPKQGIYRGFPGDNGNTVLAIRMANDMFSKTSGAFASYVTTQPALPTHP